jgi:NDP-sugar pyrophosphorylase family protein
MQAIVLAGGRGRRLYPYTTVLPKPLMPIGDCPILEVILRQLGHAGFDDVVISTGYLHGLIHAYLEGTGALRVPVRYSHESEPLGTIAPLRLIDGLEETFLVMNGDILTDLDYRALLDYHRDRGALATIATYRRDATIDFGVLERDEENRIRAFREKPVYHFDVSMGVYAFQREIFDYIPASGPFGFDDLMYALTAADAPVYSFPFDGYWLDIGRPDDYEVSIREFEEHRDRFLR